MLPIAEVALALVFLAQASLTPAILLEHSLVLFGHELQRIPPHCNSVCVNVWDTIASCSADPAVCSCAQTGGQAEQVCRDCIAGVDPSLSALAALDAYVKTCSNAEHPPAPLVPLAPTRIVPRQTSSQPTHTQSIVIAETFPPGASITPRPVNSNNDKLSLSLITDCAGSDGGIVMSNLSLSYYRANSTFEFAAIGSINAEGAFPKLQLTLKPYGITIPEHPEIDLCKGSSLCPLSLHDVFDIQLSLTLGSPVKIPPFLFKIPDVPVSLVVNITDSNSSSPLGCVKLDLSNGFTLKLPAIHGVSSFFAIGIIIVGTISPLLGGNFSSMVSSAWTATKAICSVSVPGMPSVGAPSMSVTVGAPIGPVEDFDPLSLIPQATPEPATPPPAVASPPPETAAPSFRLTVIEGLSFDLEETDGGTGATAGNLPDVGSVSFESNTPSGQPGAEPAVAQHAVRRASAAHPRGPPAGKMDPIFLFLHFQNISSSGLFSLNYPPLYLAFTANFFWANLIVPIHSFKDAARNMRGCDLDPNARNSLIPKISGLPNVFSDAPGDVVGIPAYARKIGVNEQDLFGVVLLVFVTVFSVFLSICAIVTILLQAGVGASSAKRRNAWIRRRERWHGFTSNNSLRIMTISLGSLATFAFNQWNQPCTSVLTYVVSAIALFIAVVTLGVVTYLVLRVARRPGGLQQLFDANSAYGRRWGTLYDTLREGRLFFVGIFLAVIVVRSAITSFGQGNGLLQLCLSVVLDVIVCISLVIYRPYYGPGYNRVVYLLEFSRTFSHILMVPFVKSIPLPVPAGEATALLILINQLFVAIVITYLSVLKLGWGTLWHRGKHDAVVLEKIRGSDESFLHLREKALSAPPRG